jgi:DNA polymerase III psi subunit
MKVRDFLVQSCFIQKWEFQFPPFAPLLQGAREEAVAVRVRAKTTAEHVHQEPAACLHKCRRPV